MSTGAVFSMPSRAMACTRRAAVASKSVRKNAVARHSALASPCALGLAELPDEDVVVVGPGVRHGAIVPNRSLRGDLTDCGRSPPSCAECDRLTCWIGRAGLLHTPAPRPQDPGATSRAKPAVRRSYSCAMISADVEMTRPEEAQQETARAASVLPGGAAPLRARWLCQGPCRLVSLTIGLESARPFDGRMTATSFPASGRMAALTRAPAGLESNWTRNSGFPASFELTL
jgi:hypothetical protein